MNFVSNLFRKVVDKDQSTSKSQNTTIEIQKDLKTNLHIPPKLNRSYEGPDKENSLSQSNLNRTYDGTETIKTENINIKKDKLNRSYTHELNRSFNEATNNPLDISEKSAYSLNSSFDTSHLSKSHTVKLTFDYTKNDFVEADSLESSPKDDNIVLDKDVSDDHFHLNNTFETEKTKVDNSISELNLSENIRETEPFEQNLKSYDQNVGVLKDKDSIKIVEDLKYTETYENIVEHIEGTKPHENIVENIEGMKPHENIVEDFKPHTEVCENITDATKARENIIEDMKVNDKFGNNILDNIKAEEDNENMSELQMDIDEGIYFTQPKLSLYSEPMDFEEPMDIDEDLPVVNTNSCGLFDANLTMMNSSLLSSNSTVAQCIKDSQDLLERSSEYKKPRQSIITNFDPLGDTPTNASFSDSFLTQLSSHKPQKEMEDSIKDMNDKTVILNASFEESNERITVPLESNDLNKTIEEKSDIQQNLENIQPESSLNKTIEQNEILEDEIIKNVEDEVKIREEKVIDSKCEQQTINLQNETIICSKSIEEKSDFQQIPENIQNETVVNRTFDEEYYSRKTPEKIQNETIFINKTFEEKCDLQNSEKLQNKTILVNKTFDEKYDSQISENVQNETIVVKKTIEEKSDSQTTEQLQNETVVVNRTFEEKRDSQTTEEIQNETVVVNRTFEEKCDSQTTEEIQNETVVSKILVGNCDSQFPEQLQNETIILNRTIEATHQTPEKLQNETIIINKSLEQKSDFSLSPENLQNETIGLNTSFNENCDNQQSPEKIQNETIVINKTFEEKDENQQISTNINNETIVVDKNFEHQQIPNSVHNETIVVKNTFDNQQASGNVQNETFALNKTFEDKCDNLQTGNVHKEILNKQFENKKSVTQIKKEDKFAYEIDEDNFFKPASVDMFDRPIPNSPQFEPPRMSVLTKFDPLINTSGEAPSEDSFLMQLTSYKQTTDNKLNKTIEFEKLEQEVMDENNEGLNNMLDSLEININNKGNNINAENDFQKILDTKIQPTDIFKQPSSENKFTNFDDIPIKVNKMNNIINFDDIPIQTNKNFQSEVYDEVKTTNMNNPEDKKLLNQCDTEIETLNNKEFKPQSNKEEFKTESSMEELKAQNSQEFRIQNNTDEFKTTEVTTENISEVVSNEPSSVINFDDVPIKKISNVLNIFDDIQIKPEIDDDKLLESIKSEKDQIERFINISYSTKQDNLDETSELDVIDSREEIKRIQSELKTDEDEQSKSDSSSSKNSSFNDDSPNKNPQQNIHSTDAEIERLQLKNTIDNLNAELNLCHRKINKLESELTASENNQIKLSKMLEETKKKEDCKGNQEDMLNEIATLRKSQTELEKEKMELKSQVQKLTEVNDVMQSTMNQLVSMGDQVKKERDIAQMHLTNAEAAFSDVHQKYENCKIQVQQLKIMDDKHRRDITSNIETIETQVKKYDAFKTFAMGQIEKCNLDVKEMKSKYESELAKLTAQMRRYEIKSRSLEQALEQKTKECEQLAVIYDEMVGKV